MLLLLACASDPTDSDPPVDTAEATPVSALKLVPLPNQLTELPDSFLLEPSTTIWAEGEALPVAASLAETLRRSTGLPLAMEAPGTIRLSLVDGLPAEGYRLDTPFTGPEPPRRPGTRCAS